MGVVVDVGHLSVRDVECLSENLSEFMKPFLEVVGWSSREKQLSAFVAGLLGGTERKPVEPIALAQGVDRRQLQHFVGVSPWNHLPLLGQLQREVSEEIGDPEGVLAALERWLDPPNRDEGLRILIEYNCLLADVPMVPDEMHQKLHRRLNKLWADASALMRARS
jgi:hypothetical protein